jgi:glucose/arabinose dehydrogenase
MRMKRPRCAALAAAAFIIFATAASLPRAQSRGAAPPCEPGNGGITLPQGFCAVVVADGLGAARHLAVAPNGDLFVSIRSQGGTGGGIVALRDTNGDGKADLREAFGSSGGTGVALRNGFLYHASITSVVRYKIAPGALKPTGEMETIVEGLPNQRSHAEKGIAFDGRGGLYVNVGAPSNACQQPDRRAKVPGQDPCPLLDQHGGIWRFDENKPGQKQADGTRFATGLRQMIGLAWHDNALWVVMHNRDSLDTLWPGQFTAEHNAEWPAEYLVRATDGSNFGWPYCFYSNAEKRLVTNPEYGGDGKKSDRCGSFTPPAVAFPGHWAPDDLLFYTGTQFPKQYQGGAFVAFHGSWNRAPLPQGGYNVTFVPFSGGKPGARETFADGFAGKSPLSNPDDAAARPAGLAIGPDGSLYIAEDAKGRVWRVIYTGK